MALQPRQGNNLTNNPAFADDSVQRLSLVNTDAFADSSVQPTQLVDTDSGFGTSALPFLSHNSNTRHDEQNVDYALPTDSDLGDVNNSTAADVTNSEISISSIHHNSHRPEREVRRSLVHQDTGYAELDGDVSIHEINSQDIDIRHERRKGRCKTCFRGRCEFINHPCGHQCNCKNCIPHMLLCSVCGRHILEVLPHLNMDE